MGAEVPARDSTGTALDTVSLWSLQQTMDSVHSWARRKGLGAPPPFSVGETEAREVESYSFGGETLISLHPGFLIHASFTAWDFVLLLLLLLF